MYKRQKVIRTEEENFARTIDGGIRIYNEMLASHKEKGAAEALMLLRNAGRVSSVCNDVVGDICGIVSGTTAAVIVVRLQAAFGVESVLMSVGVTALISGLTIGGKALGKTVAIRSSTQVVYWVGRFLHLFHR